MKLRALVAGFRGQPWYVHVLAVVSGLALYGAVYAAAVVVQGGVPLLWVTGARPFRWRAALLAGGVAGGYYGWLVTRARGGPTTNLLAVIAGPLVVPQVVAWLLGDRVPGDVVSVDRGGTLLLAFLSLAAGVAVVWSWGRRLGDPDARQEWLAENLPDAMEGTFAQVSDPDETPDGPRTDEGQDTADGGETGDGNWWDRR